MLLGTTLYTVHAQDDSTAVKTSEVKTPPLKSYGKLTLNYLTNSVYNGRQDSLKTPYLTPMLGYYAKSGFFVDGSFSYLTRSGSNRIDLATIDMGYDFSAGNFDGEVMGSKYYYNSASTNVKSEISSSLAASAAYDFGFIHPTLLGTLNFGKSTDYALMFSLDHAFYAAHDNLVITPTVLMNASTQNYYASYYNNRKYKVKKKTYLEINADVAQASKFKPLDYEFTMPVDYTVKDFTFSFLPSFAIPVNPAVVTVTAKASAGSATITRTATEKTSNVFFCAFEVSYKF